MTILDIIEKKRDKKELTKEEIYYFVKEYTEERINDYQAAALIMAIFINGMTKEETTNLTLAMANSGEVLDLSKLNKIIVDKHSTGGVGDKVSIVLLPLVSSLGVSVAKMSGRGLGFTGGTADKLEAIPGYKTNIDIKEFIKNVEEIGISMITQTLNLAPADKKIYALRSTIACVESIPLIASSIMSKKIASGAQKIVIDVTVGKGAFMKNIKEAEKLATEMIEIGKLANRQTVCVLTNMEEPIGFAVGNSLEVMEAIKFLKGEKIEDLEQVVFELGAYMLKLAGVEKNLEKAKKLLRKNIENGKAYEKFIELVKKQGGDTSYLLEIENFEKAKYIEPLYSNKKGYIYEINAKEIGQISCNLGAGRNNKEDKIEMEVGILLKKKIGDFVNNEEILAYIYANDFKKLEEAKQRLTKTIKIKRDKTEKLKTIIKVIE